MINNKSGKTFWATNIEPGCQGPEIKICSDLECVHVLVFVSASLNEIFSIFNFIAWKH